MLRIPTGRRQTRWLCTSAVEVLNQGLPQTNPAIVVRVGPELRISRFQIQCPNRSAMLPVLWIEFNLTCVSF